MKKLFIIMAMLCIAFGTAMAADEPKELTVVITSDWHIGDARSAKLGWSSVTKNNARIAKFLQSLYDTKDEWDVLVLNGDIFEFWRSPADTYMQADEDGNIMSTAQYIKQIVAYNQSVFDNLQKLRDAGKEIVYLNGNHDMSLTTSDIEEALPGLFNLQYITADAPGLGLYEPVQNLAIEHGHRYEYFNAPDPLVRNNLPSLPETFNLASGMFITKIDATKAQSKTTTAQAKDTNAKAARCQALRQQLMDIIDKRNNTTAAIDDETTVSQNKNAVLMAWLLIAAVEGINPKNKNLTMNVGLAGYNDSFTWDYYFPDISTQAGPKLYDNSWLPSVWEDRCRINKTPFTPDFLISVAAAQIMELCDSFAIQQRLSNPLLPTAVCVFGHTHEKIVRQHTNPVKGDVLYLNIGAWLDNVETTNYGVVKYAPANGQQQTNDYTVSLWQFDEDGTATEKDKRIVHVPTDYATQNSDGTWTLSGKKTYIDIVTEISEIENTAPKLREQRIGTYNLAGQRVSNDAKGLVIRNSKKVLVK